MIVKVLGLGLGGECLERQAEELNLWETEAKLRVMARALARDYLKRWPTISAVAIRKDADNRLIVKVPRKAVARA